MLILTSAIPSIVFKHLVHHEKIPNFLARSQGYLPAPLHPYQPEKGPCMDPQACSHLLPRIKPVSAPNSHAHCMCCQADKLSKQQTHIIQGTHTYLVPPRSMPKHDMASPHAETCMQGTCTTCSRMLHHPPHGHPHITSPESITVQPHHVTALRTPIAFMVHVHGEKSAQYSMFSNPMMYMLYDPGRNNPPVHCQHNKTSNTHYSTVGSVQ